MGANIDALLLEYVKDLDRRVKVLETSADRGEMQTVQGDELVAKYGEFVDKSAAARILGVTRATIYAMIADGRVNSACEGTRVSVRSIANYIARKGKKHAS